MVCLAFAVGAIPSSLVGVVSRAILRRQTQAISHVRIRDLVAGPNRRFPVARKTDSGYQLVVPGAPSKPININDAQSIPDRLDIASGVEVSIGKDKGAACLFINGRSARLQFGEF